MPDKFQIQWPIDDLPKMCVYSLDNDYYSQFYEVEQTCECGCSNWITSTLTMNVFEDQLSLTPKRIQRCVDCKKVRISKIKEVFEEIIDATRKVFEIVKNLNDDFKELCVLKNIFSKMEIQRQVDKIQHIKQIEPYNSYALNREKSELEFTNIETDIDFQDFTKKFVKRHFCNAARC